MAALSLAMPMIILGQAQPANATFPGGFTLSFNMRGANGSVSGYNSSVVNALITSLGNRDPQPTIIMVQEVCQSQAGALWSYLSARGYEAQGFMARQTPSSSLNSSCGS